MVKKRMLLRDLITRLAQASPGEIYVDIEEVQQDVFVVPLSGILGVPDSTGILNRLHESSGIIQAGPAIEFRGVDGIAGNGTSTLPAGEIWEVRSLTYTSLAGGNFGINDGAVLVSPITAIGAGGIDDLVNVPIPLAGGAIVGINGGVIGDNWNLRAVRLL